MSGDSSFVSTAELVAILSVPNIGRRTVINLLKVLKKYELSFGDFWHKLPARITNLILSGKQVDSVKNFKNEYTISSYLEYLESEGIGAVSYNDLNYPPLLLHTSDYPLALFVKGDSALLQKTQMVAVVGTRRITSYGQLATAKLVGELVLEGAVITSGFMYGVDAKAHKETLRMGGKTVGVLGYGFNYLYPRSQEALFQEMIDGGGVFVTEYPPSTSPKAGQFPARNRIIAGISQATLVVEAGERSGSAITANFALEEGRLVCAVPGPITSPFSEGTRYLLQQGALLVGSGSEVIDELRHQYPDDWSISEDSEGSPQPRSINSTSTEQIICDMLLTQSLNTETLSEKLDLPVVKLSTLLTRLELNGKIIRSGPNWTLKD